ncbi:M56 family metallopeptidase [Roseisolibacter agri]|uniref:Peptidase M56 domain-containing protein n=1 Tax=Roseisolibacter agri TaxID=2014610 RepID=A0AA37V8J2_9BACT|nr:M56 family metallopeptidase [Roseisolibacter agri]GLC23488.1 hypothetical protein rosag_00010 [Roseisolibacter agri]
MSGGAALGALWNGYVVLLHATLCLGGVTLALPIARRVGPAARAHVHAAALVGMLLVSVLCWLPVGAWGRGVPAPVAAPLLALGAAAMAFPTGEAAARTTATLATALLALWIGGALLVLARMAAGWWSVRAITRRATPVTDRAWTRALRDACTAMGTHQGVELRLSDEVATPLTWGTLDPVILLPSSAAVWPAERRRLALLHELAHVRRLDCVVQALAHVAFAWYWFHPAAWWARRGLRDAREEACDARVLAAGVRPSEYAQCLLDVAAEARGRTLHASASLAMARAPQLHTRVRRVLATRAGAPVHATPTWVSRGVLAAALAWMLLLGSLRLGPDRALLWDALGGDAWPRRAYAAAVLGQSRFPQVRAELRARAADDPHPVVRRLARAAR